MYTLLKTDFNSSLLDLLVSAMNGSLSDSSEKSFEGDDDVEEEYVTPKCDELLHLSNLVNELSYDPAVPNNVTQAYLQKV